MLGLGLPGSSICYKFLDIEVEFFGQRSPIPPNLCYNRVILHYYHLPSIPLEYR